MSRKHPVHSSTTRSSHLAASVSPNSFQRLFGRALAFSPPSLSSANFEYRSNSCFTDAKKNALNCKDFICFTQPDMRRMRRGLDLISLSSDSRSSPILPLFFFHLFFSAPSCDIAVQRAARWLRAFERRRGGQGRIATSGTTQPLRRRAHARVSAHNWPWVLLQRVCTS